MVAALRFVPVNLFWYSSPLVAPFHVGLGLALGGCRGVSDTVGFLKLGPDATQLVVLLDVRCWEKPVAVEGICLLGDYPANHTKGCLEEDGLSLPSCSSYPSGGINHTRPWSLERIFPVSPLQLFSDGNHKRPRGRTVHQSPGDPEDCGT